MSAGELLRGVSPVLSVPFHEDGALDLPGFVSVVDHVLATGVSSVLLFGLASEFAKLEDAERQALLTELLARTRDRRDVSAIVSVTDHSAEVAVRRARTYAEAGVDVINVLPPSFLSPSRRQVLDHVASICAAVDVPVVLQYAPSQTGVPIAVGEIVTLAHSHPNLEVVKVESQPPGRMVQELLEASGGRVRSLVGYAGVQWPDAHRRGAVGVQPGCSATEVYVRAQQLLDNGDEAGFLAVHGRALPWLTYWMQSVELVVAAEKLVLQRRGIIASARCRRPRYELDQGEVARVDAFLTEFDELLS
jgi:4-hydroxy-tetrahydrodipicolinate synthase